MISSGNLGEVVFIDHVNRRTRGFTDSSVCEMLRVEIEFELFRVLCGCEDRERVVVVVDDVLYGCVVLCR